MNNPPNPDPIKFSREVLWHLCGMRAETRVMLQMMSRLIEADVNKANAMYLEWIAQTVSTQQKFFAVALEQIGIPPAEGQGLESSGDDLSR